jgi:hypothetical protein
MGQKPVAPVDLPRHAQHRERAPSAPASSGPGAARSASAIGPSPRPAEPRGRPRRNPRRAWHPLGLLRGGGGRAPKRPKDKRSRRIWNSSLARSSHARAPRTLIPVKPPEFRRSPLFSSRESRHGSAHARPPRPRASPCARRLRPPPDRGRGRLHGRYAGRRASMPPRPDRGTPSSGWHVQRYPARPQVTCRERIGRRPTGRRSRRARPGSSCSTRSMSAPI